MNKSQINAEVISVFPNKVKILVDNLEDYNSANRSLRVGSYLKISDNEDTKLFAIIENFSLEIKESGRKYLIEAMPIGIIKNNIFTRGGDTIAIPPKKVEPATEQEIIDIFKNSDNKDNFIFSRLLSNPEVRIPINGNKFFNKHIAIVGSTGSGKSHTISKIIQSAVEEKNGTYSLNNSHIIIFDIHSEYKSAFPKANIIDIENLILPYWLLNSEELEDILLDTGERDNYNQSSIFRTLVTENKKKHNRKIEKIYYDSPVFFCINEVKNAIYNYKNETINAKNNTRYMINDGTSCFKDQTDENSGIELNDENRIEKYFTEPLKFFTTKAQNIKKGDYADGSLDKFYIRLNSKISNDRLQFLFGEKSKNAKFENVLSCLMGYNNKSNVTIIDLSGVPFEVLSITVSLISRLLFEYGYIYKKIRCEKDSNEEINNDIPFLLVYEEAHKYAPNSDLTKFRSSKNSIERIAKEGRKYGISLLLSSQRPSEISETIFSQCNNFIAMRLTNPNDQNYVKKLLPDTLGNLIDMMPSLKAGEALLVGEAIMLPSLVQIDQCSPNPSSIDIPYLNLWKQEWKELRIDEIKEKWQNGN
ncbi:DUF87 domain-containing protein [Silvanigrella paludirubra]|uniref:DUF87 domain-containing protein n=1 Tax=Silvanigrella paludirubra TaxID=2499159 RepID=A0A6N6VWM8_9BACT|nr:anti-phage-associated helicase HerA [Silvanigrella paludirubra]KAB8040409.1 DUF87 domain-containing protein [Silvanigrella paludirubra]